MLKVQVQLPFGETLPTHTELGWNVGEHVVRGEKINRAVNHTDEEDYYNPDDPDQEGLKFGFSIG